MSNQDRFRLPLLVLGVAAVHGLCLAAILPMLITLPGESDEIAVDVELAPSPSALAAPAIAPRLDQSAGIEPNADIPVAPPAESASIAGESASATPSAPAEPDPADVTSALPAPPQVADPSAPAAPPPAPSKTAATDVGIPPPADTASSPLGDRPPDTSPTTPLANIDPEAPGSSQMTEQPAEEAATDQSSAPDAAPLPDAKPKVPEKLEKPASQKRAATPAKRPKPLLRRVAKPQVKTQAKAEQGTGSFGSLFQGSPVAQPKPKVTPGRNN